MFKKSKEATNIRKKKKVIDTTWPKRPHFLFCHHTYTFNRIKFPALIYIDDDTGRVLASEGTRLLVARALGEAQMKLGIFPSLA